MGTGPAPPPWYPASVLGDRGPHSTAGIPQTRLQRRTENAPPSPWELPQTPPKQNSRPPEPSCDGGGRAGLAWAGRTLDIWVPPSSSPRALPDSGTVEVIDPPRTIQPQILIGRGGQRRALERKIPATPARCGWGTPLRGPHGPPLGELQEEGFFLNVMGSLSRNGSKAVTGLGRAHLAPASFRRHKPLRATQKHSLKSWLRTC